MIFSQIFVANQKNWFLGPFSSLNNSSQWSILCLFKYIIVQLLILGLKHNSSAPGHFDLPRASRVIPTRRVTKGRSLPFLGCFRHVERNPNTFFVSYQKVILDHNILKQWQYSFYSFSIYDIIFNQFWDKRSWSFKTPGN